MIHTQRSSILSFPTSVFFFLHSLIALIRTSGTLLKIRDVKRHVWIIPYMKGNIRKTFQHQFWYFCCSVAQSCPPPLWPHGLQHISVSLSFTISWILLKLMSSESVMPSNHLILCHSILLLLSVFPSIRVFSNEFDSSHQVAKVLELQLPHQSSNEYSGLISFMID